MSNSDAALIASTAAISPERGKGAFRLATSGWAENLHVQHGFPTVRATAIAQGLAEHTRDQ